jgi:hypothetical protein
VGWWFAASVSPGAILAALGAISILFGAYRLWADRGGGLAAPSNSPAWVGGLFGAATGFTSQIAHAGGPPFQMWVLPRRLPRDVLVGTTAIFFAILNWVKVPAFVALGQFTRPNAVAALTLLPVAILASLAGVRLVRRISAERFYTIVYLLMIAAGAAARRQSRARLKEASTRPAVGREIAQPADRARDGRTRLERPHLVASAMLGAVNLDDKRVRRPEAGAVALEPAHPDRSGVTTHHRAPVGDGQAPAGNGGDAAPRLADGSTGKLERQGIVVPGSRLLRRAAGKREDKQPRTHSHLQLPPPSTHRIGFRCAIKGMTPVSSNDSPVA